MVTVKDRLITFKDNLIVAKNNLATAITGKGVTANGTDSFADLATKIGEISNSDTTIHIPIGARVIIDNSNNIIQNEYGKFVKTGSSVDILEYPELASYATEIRYSSESIVPIMQSNNQNGWTLGFSTSLNMTTGNLFDAFDGNDGTSVYYSSDSSLSSVSMYVTVTFPTNYKIGKITANLSATPILNNSGKFYAIANVNGSTVYLPSNTNYSKEFTFNPVNVNQIQLYLYTYGNKNAFPGITLNEIKIFSATDTIPLENSSEGLPLFIRYQ
jgi:3D (Asp-Asp-Asp) domain-containing protein